MGVRDALVLVVSYYVDYVDYDRNLPWLSYRIEGWLLSYPIEWCIGEPVPVFFYRSLQYT